MIGNILYGKKWWAWWSNPTIGMHDDHRYRLAMTPQNVQQLDYFRLLDIRSQIELPDIPDEALVNYPELRCLAFLNEHQLNSHLYKFAVLTFDSTVIQANASDWKTSYGIGSPELIKDLMRQRADMPKQILYWQEQSSRTLSSMLTTQLLLTERIQLGLGLYLRAYFPKYFQRWILICSRSISSYAEFLDPMPDDQFDVLRAWCSDDILKCSAEIQKVYCLPDFNLTMDEEFNSEVEEFSQIDSGDTDYV